jgi:hypothetical protein
MKTHLISIAAFVCFAAFAITQSDSRHFTTALFNTRDVDTTWASWAKETVIADFSIAGKADFVGTLTHEFNGFANEPERQKMKELSDRNYKTQMWSTPNFKVQSLEFLNADNPHKPLKRIALCTLNHVVTQLNDYLSFQLPVVSDFTYNPFAHLEHEGNQYTFSHKIDHIYRLSLEIPSGYSLAALPENMEFTLSDDNSKIQYLNYVSDNKIHVTARLLLTKNIYDDNDFAIIRLSLQKLLAKKMEITLLRKRNQETAKKN